MDDTRITALDARIGLLTEERDALARPAIDFIRECGPRFGDGGHILVGELTAKHGVAMTAVYAAPRRPAGVVRVRVRPRRPRPPDGQHRVR